MNVLIPIICLAATIASVKADDIIVSMESNGVLSATGMIPGSACTIEWSYRLDEGFTNAAIDFSNIEVQEDGSISFPIPMFFRVKGYAPRGVTLPLEDMVLVPAGSFITDDPDEGNYELVVDAFYVKTTEVTKAEWDDVANWAAVNGYDISSSDADGVDTNYPATSLSYYECVKWCNAKSEMEGRTTCYTVDSSTYRTGEHMPSCDVYGTGYRLPSGMEWEYVARGGISGLRFPWGLTISHTQANYMSDETFSYDVSASRGYHPTFNGPSPVSYFSATGFGVSDICGNVAEWCNTLNYTSVESVFLMGGSWYSSSTWGRCSAPIYEGQQPELFSGLQSNNAIGFRTVCQHLEVSSPLLPTNYVVQSGDTLSKLANKFYGDSSKWDDIYYANHDQMTSPYHLVVGQVIYIPAI